MNGSDPVTVDEGLALHRAGKLSEAADIYRRVLARDPSNADALHYLGVIASMQGDQLGSVDLISRAIAIRSGAPKFHNNLGVALRELKRWQEAEASFRRAIELQPDFSEAMKNLASALDAQDRPAETVVLWRNILRLDPDSADGWNRLGLALSAAGSLEEAAEAFQHVVRLAPTSAIGHANLATALNDCMDYAAALSVAERCLALAPDLPEARLNLVTALNGIHRTDEALVQARMMERAHPDFSGTYMCLGYALQQSGDSAGALRAYDRALELEPGHAGTAFRRGMVRLLRGDFRGGWPDYEQRWRTPRFVAMRRRRSAELWKGEPLDGKRILVRCEQGVGDTLNFIRYLPLVAARGGIVILECQAALKELLRGVPGAHEVVSENDSVPVHDVETTLMSLPGIFRTTVDTIPVQQELDVTRSAALLARGADYKVGLVWAGNPKHSNDRNRSMALSLFEPLLEVEGVGFYSLQVGPRAADIRGLRHPGRLHDLSPNLKSYSDTASMLRQLDLVISVDTSVVHLAGVLGRPVWTLLPFVPDWRWLLEREDSPWYPTMRLFRQRREGDWSEVVQRVAAELGKLREVG